jgi:hypothetical protein
MLVMDDSLAFPCSSASDNGYFRDSLAPRLTGKMSTIGARAMGDCGQFSNPDLRRLRCPLSATCCTVFSPLIGFGWWVERHHCPIAALIS